MKKLNTVLLAGFLASSGLGASTYDHYTFQYGTASGPDASYSFSAMYGNIDSSVFAPHEHGDPNLGYANATVGYHDSLIIFAKGFTTGQTGTLDLSYLLYSGQQFNDGGGASAFFTASGLGLESTYNRPYMDHFNLPAVPGQITFQYGVAFSLDATVNASAGAADGEGYLRLNSLSVETSSPFLWSSSSGTQYNFLNGTFTPTPEPGTIFLSGIGGCLLGIGRSRSRKN